ncbi:uncharacterized protein LOC144712496 [Wolffia australiana]
MEELVEEWDAAREVGAKMEELDQAATVPEDEFGAELEQPEATFIDEVDLTNIDYVFDAEESAAQEISLGDVVRRLREVVVAIRGSSKKEAKYFYYRQLNKSNTRRILIECPTRRSPTFKMLSGCIEKKFIIDMLMSNVLPKRYLLDAEWDLIEKFVDLLKPLQQGTSVAIRSKAPTSNEGIVIIKGLMRHLERIREGVTESSTLLVEHTMSAKQRNALSNVCSAMRAKIEKYVSLQTRNEAFTIASLLDPSMKLCLIDPRAKNDVLSTVRNIMQSHSASRNVGSRSTERFDLSTMSDFIQMELQELLDPSEILQRVDPIEELDVYVTAPPAFGTEVLHWWKMTGQLSFPMLALVPKEFLVVQATSAACERLFSEGRRVINYMRSRLTAESVEVLMMLKSWYNNEDLRANEDEDGDENGGPVNICVDAS